MSEPTLQDCINYMRSQIKQMEKHPRNYEFNLPYYRKTVELLEKLDRPHGEWNTTPNPNYSPFDSTSEVIYMCSQCAYSSGDRITETWHYCPNCGADMREIKLEGNQNPCIKCDAKSACQGICKKRYLWNLRKEGE